MGIGGPDRTRSRRWRISGKPNSQIHPGRNCTSPTTPGLCANVLSPTGGGGTKGHLFQRQPGTGRHVGGRSPGAVYGGTQTRRKPSCCNAFRASREATSCASSALLHHSCGSRPFQSRRTAGHRQPTCPGLGPRHVTGRMRVASARLQLSKIRLRCARPSRGNPSRKAVCRRNSRTRRRFGVSHRTRRR